MPKTIDEALALPGEKVAAWEELPDGRSWLGVYLVSDSGASVIAHELMDPAARDVSASQLRVRRIRVGETGGGFLWTGEGGYEFVAWSRTQKLFRARKYEVTVGREEVGYGDVLCVSSFVDPDDLGHRGVGLELRDGKALVLAREQDATAAMDPTYNRDNLLIDGAWIWSMGRQLAAFIGVPYEDSATRPAGLKRQSEALAQQLLEEMRRPGQDPARLEYEARKDAADRAALKEYYWKTGQARDTRPRARSSREMQFAAELEGCRHCGSTAPAKLDLVRADEEHWGLRGPCPACHQMRWHSWLTDGNPLNAEVPPSQLGNARPSQILRPGQFMAELQRVLPQVGGDPGALDAGPWRASAAAQDRALICLNELLKFIPAGMKIFPDTLLTPDETGDRAAHRERYTRAWLDGQVQRLKALHERYVADAPRIWEQERRGRPPYLEPKGAIDRDALRAHADWVQRGRTGEGRLDVVGYNARELGLSGVQFAGARLVRVTFDRARLVAARMQGCALREVSVDEANAESLQLNGATIIGGSFLRSALPLADFDDAVIEGTSFEGSNFDRSQWPGARVTDACFDRAWFSNARLRNVHFLRCSFRGAEFQPKVPDMKAPTDGAVFEECDLRDTLWEGRDLSNATFLRCKFAGAHGRPVAWVNVRIIDPDLSPAGDGTQIGTAEDVLRLWGLAATSSP